MLSCHMITIPLPRATRTVERSLDDRHRVATAQLNNVIHVREVCVLLVKRGAKDSKDRIEPYDWAAAPGGHEATDARSWARGALRRAPRCPKQCHPGALYAEFESGAGLSRAIGVRLVHGQALGLGTPLKTCAL